MTFLVTGGAGFIGSHFAKMLLEQGHRVVILDALTYAGFRVNIPKGAHFVRGDICSKKPLESIFKFAPPDAVFNFAAESHVCRSIDEPSRFVRSNVKGTLNLLQECLRYWQDGHPNFRYIQVSTDEVFGDLGPDDPPFTEESPYRPNSPYAASKAGADHLVRAWHHTYGFPGLITNCSNNYGPRQFPEKLIPKMINEALRGGECVLHGDGSNVRDWISVEDHCSGVWLAYLHGTIGRSYLFGGKAERTNLEVLRGILKCLHLDESLVRFGPDRPGNDRRYALDPSRAERELGWSAQTDFERGLHATVQWYKEHRAWTDYVLRDTKRGVGNAVRIW